MVDDNIINIYNIYIYINIYNIISVCSSPIESSLYPFGAEVGDKGLKMDAEDGNSPYITPPMGFPFMGRLYERVYVSF